jgi:ribonuclease BN (tRNA processing enzyme)
MKLVLLGTTGYHPNDLRQTACFMLPELGIVLDAGTGFYRVRDYLETPTLDVFLSHAHLDHVVGLTYLFDVLHQRPLERVTIRGEAAKLASVQQHLLNESLFPAPLPCEFQPLTGPFDLPEGGRLTYFPLVHPGGSLGFRLDWPGRSLAYVTDTTAHAKADYVPRIRGVDLLVHECYFPDGCEELAQRTGHSCTSAVAETAQAAGVGQLVLVHGNPLVPQPDPIDLPAARRIFADTVVGTDRMVIDF